MLLQKPLQLANTARYRWLDVDAVPDTLTRSHFFFARTVNPRSQHDLSNSAFGKGLAPLSLTRNHPHHFSAIIKRKPDEIGAQATDCLAFPIRVASKIKEILEGVFMMPEQKYGNTPLMFPNKLIALREQA